MCSSYVSEDDLTFYKLENIYSLLYQIYNVSILHFYFRLRGKIDPFYHSVCYTILISKSILFCLQIFTSISIFSSYDFFGLSADLKNTK